MKTTIQTFCKAFSEELEPFFDDLAGTLPELPELEGMESLGASRRGLKEVQQRLSTLREKVSNQRTFLLIFGPLKSGKSTLMNALSGSYVSEVSSLPAYPALVYVKHGEQRRFEATDYAGHRREFADSQSLAEAVHTDHSQLADAIVAAEGMDEKFEPQKHHPQAIRRMDIEVPARHLAESGSVLVDTPGLYSRMKFGYDQMTRDFRDTAACAIFVVKTDNLFFEKVFEEFEELLSCFSRIFLVSNIDSSKQDLRPDGSLEASVESREPERIIDAFRSLSMSATLRTAIDDGRLKIYPIDLLRAASAALRGAQGDEDAPEADRPGDGFDQFITDLTAYLNGSDYLHDFMVDSLRLAQDLTAEAGALASGDAAAELDRSGREAHQALERQRSALSALDGLEQQDWSDAFEALQASKDRLLTEATETSVAELEQKFQEQLTAWMESDESWNALQDQRFKPSLEQAAARQARLLRERLRALVEDELAGAEFSEAQQRIFANAGLRMEEALAGMAQGFDDGIHADTPHLALDAGEVPVERTLVDYLLLRGRTRVRRELFGDHGNRTAPASIKAKRLAGPGLEQLRATLRDIAATDVPALQRRYAEQLLEAHIGKCTKALQRNIADRRARLHEEIGKAEKTLRLRQQAQQLLESLQQFTLRFESAVTELRKQYEL